MPIPEALIKESHETLYAADLSELQSLIRAGLHGHIHGQDAALVPATALDPKTTVSVDRIEAASATFEGKDLLGQLGQRTSVTQDVEGNLAAPGDLTVSGALQVGGRYSSPRVQVATAEVVSGSPTILDWAAQAENYVTGWWRMLRGLSVKVHLAERRPLLLTTLFPSAQNPVVARHCVVTMGDRRIPAACTLVTPQTLESDSALWTWFKHNGTNSDWWQGVLLDGGTLMEAISLPPGDYTISTELLVWPGLDVSDAILTVTQL